jgi:hypothetical protein
MDQNELARVQGNIKRMIDLGAPEADIDAYAAQEGVTPEMFRGAPAMPTAAPVQTAPAPAAAPAPVASASASVAPAPAQSFSMPGGSVNPREAKLGVQGAGRGLADLAGMPVDLMTAGINAATWLPGKAMGKDLSIRKPFMGGDSIADMFSSVAESLGYKNETPQTMRDKVIYNTNRFGAGAGGGMGAFSALSRAPGVVGSKIGQMFETLGNTQGYVAAPVRAGVQDVAASVGAGATTAAADTWLSPEVKNSAMGPLIEYAATMIGGLGGAGTAGAVQAGGRATSNYVQGKLGMGVPIDPKTGLPFADATGRAYTPAEWEKAQRLAHMLVSGEHSPSGVVKNIEEFYAGMPANESMSSLPTVGYASGNTGLGIAEQTRRQQDPAPFINRDANVQSAAVRQVESIAPDQNGLPRAEPVLERAAVEAETPQFQAQYGAAIERGEPRYSGQLADERTAVEAQQAQLQQQTRTANAGLQPNPQRSVEASQSLDRAVVEGALDPMTTAKNADFDAIPNTPVQPYALTNLRDDMMARYRDVDGPTRAANVPDDFLRQIEGFLVRDEGGNVTGVRQIGYRDIELMRPAIEARINELRRSGGSPVMLDNLRAIKTAISDITRELPEGAAALDRFGETYSPVWGREAGPAASFRKDVNSDRFGRSVAPPEKTAGRLVRPNEPTTTESLQRILNSMEDPAQGQAAVREVLMADLANKNVLDAATGAIRPDQLRKWAQAQNANLNLVPGLRDEIGVMMEQARRGETLNTQFGDQLRDIRRREQITPERVSKNALSELSGLDGPNAIGKILGGGNPGARMKEVADAIKNDPAAKDGLRAAFREYLLDVATNNAPQKTSGGENPVGFAKLNAIFKSHREAMSHALSPEDMNALQQAHKMLETQQGNFKSAAGGSQTAERASNAMKMLEAGLKAKYGMLKGGGIMRTMRLVAETFPSNQAAVESIMTKMMLDPDVAKHLLGSKPRDVAGDIWNKRLFQLLALGNASRTEEGQNGGGGW